MKKFLFLPFLFVLLSFFACKEETPDFPFPTGYYGTPNYDPLDTFITNRMAANNIPGLSAALIKNNKVDWIKSYGFAEIDSQKVVNSTLFMLADAAIPVTAAAVLQLAQEGKVDLDADINDYLPFEVRNPTYPSNAISLRMLLSHSSSIKDKNQILNMLYGNGAAPMSLENFIRSYLSAGGNLYNPTNFNTDKPGKIYGFSKVGIALAGYVVESITGIEFNQYCLTHIFAELGVFDTSWYLADLNFEKVAFPYTNNTPTPMLKVQHYEYPFYPWGQLRTSIEHLSRFWLAMSTNGTYKARVLLDSTHYATMKTVPFPLANLDQALGWRYKSFNGRTVLGQNGSDVGVSSRMWFDTASNTGVVILANTDNNNATLDAIMERLFMQAGI
jgi:CubicO group peptidase (beta-lactamase class C family)